MQDTEDMAIPTGVAPYVGATEQAKAQEIIDKSESTTKAGKRRDKIRALATLSQMLDRHSLQLEQRETEHLKRQIEMQKEAADLELYLMEKARQTQEQLAAIVGNTMQIATAYAESSLKPAQPTPTAGESAVAALAQMTGLAKAVGIELIRNQPAIGFKLATLINPSVPMPEPSKITSTPEAQPDAEPKIDPSVNELYALLEKVDPSRLSAKLQELGFRDDELGRLPISAILELLNAA